MGRFFDFLFKNPILLFVIGAWLIGMIGNMAKARGKVRERKAKQTGQTPLPQQNTQQAPPRGQSQPAQMPTQTVPQPRRGSVATQTPTATRAPTAPRQPAQQSAADVAREMRRILGLDPDASRPGQAGSGQAGTGAPAASSKPWPAPSDSQSMPRTIQRDAPPMPERQRRPASNEPATAAPQRGPTRDRKLELHEQSHVGEQMRDRHMSRGKVGEARAGRSAMGSLGGGRKQQAMGHRSGMRSRNAMNDLRRAVVMSEILAPPLALRPHTDRLPR